MLAKAAVIEINPRKMSGMPVFSGTRVRVKTLFDYLEGGDNIERFLDHFPTVDRGQAVGVLEICRVTLLQAYEPTL